MRQPASTPSAKSPVAATYASRSWNCGVVSASMYAEYVTPPSGRESRSVGRTWLSVKPSSSFPTGLFWIKRNPGWR